MPTARPTRLDLSAITAVAWVCVAVGLTLAFGPQLGARGWVWLGLHHLLCLVGVTHEYRRYQQRQRLSAAATPAAAPAAAPADPAPVPPASASVPPSP